MKEGEVRGSGCLPKTVESEPKTDKQLKEFELSCEYVHYFVVVDVKLAEYPIEAIVDTAAQVTVVNTDVFTNIFFFFFFLQLFFIHPFFT